MSLDRAVDSPAEGTPPPASAPAGLDAVFWDMDGTLVDTEPLWNESHRRMLESAGGTWTEELAHALTGQSLDHGARLLQQAGVDLDSQEIVETALQEVAAGLQQTIPWRPGALELLRELKDAGVPCALVTMSHAPLAQIILDATPAGALEFMVTGDEVTRGKPDPEPYLAALAQMDRRHPGLDRSRCVVLEDSLPGVTSALAAGLATVAVPMVTEIPEDPRRCIWTSLSGRRAQDLADVAQELGTWAGAGAPSWNGLR
ncbi:HAD family hydrolase [Micrococcus terreus]|uniref:HAD family hydrolase n=1 Tax=Micrococcus terreus TaxID=574650 RepID=UPI0025506E55|nr:HAD family phosphatase [Micrococcus terreus]MDK7699915.1 HAD family phosphatase [Micrococcus terreus]WOO98305.1 HAD family phosphatase [Micrococcus terreus]